MLLGVDRAENLETESLGIQRPLAIILSLGFVALLITTILQGRDSLNMRGEGLITADSGDHDANIRQIARSIFSDYVVAFEVTSVLLIVAVVGTVVLARKRKSEKDLTGVSA
jgi:NADH-quinone oxidoreductase subunit J